MSTLFVTGSSGFIGSHLLRELDAGPYERITCLSRSEPSPVCEPQHRKIRYVQGDLNNADVYAPYLAASDTVVHLAAATGKRSAREYTATNESGTRVLLEQCARAGVRRVLFASTIAVKYKHRTGYAYAQSKSAGEDLVKASGLPYAIVRPTIVIGRDGAAWQSILRLASYPVMLMFGDGRTRIQPIYIDDLIACMRLILSEGMFTNETFELGGPEITSFDGFFRAIARRTRRSQPLILHLPAKAAVPWLLRAERRFSSRLPLSAGQLTVFYNDGTIDANEVFMRQAPHMLNVPEMLARVTSHD